MEWLQKIATENNFPNIALLEKSIRAFSLLESLALSGCPFVFKGGTALMLHLDSAKRLSIDIDIICPPNTNIEEYLYKNADIYGFSEIKLIERKTDHNVPCVADLLGDKLTAFAPNTTGITYYKGNKMCSMEIIKQLYDIASLFEITNDLTIVSNTFRNFAVVELAYRNLNPNDIGRVLDDIFQTSLCVCMQGKIDNEHFKLLQDGIKRIQSFINSERYTLDSAIINASKVAYLSTLIANNLTEVEHFDKKKIVDMQNITIEYPLPTKLNKLKKNNIEAFYYWVKVFEIVKK